MASNFFKSFFITTIIIAIIVSCFILLIISISSNSNGKFIWPLPNYTFISSYFGNRASPTSKASSSHSGIDIPAPEGTPILAVCSGEVTFASWGAGGGYTIVIKNENLNISVSYCHVSPNFIVSRGSFVEAGDIISSVGPKNVYGITNNPYTDSMRRAYKRCNYRLPLAFNYKKRRHSRQSIRLL